MCFIRPRGGSASFTGSISARNDYPIPWTWKWANRGFKENQIPCCCRVLLPMLGMVLVLINYFLPFIFGINWVTGSNLLLHIGVLIAIFGLMLAWAL